ncbi:hypothetical protein AALC16_01625 [Lachnospiraceae bacterium 29-91]
MGFGEKLRIILELHDIKVYNLASYLGYDASYISKWMTGSKTPSSKHVRKINCAISEFCAKEGTSAQKKETLAFLKSDIDYTNSDAYATIISKYLSDSDEISESTSPSSGDPSFSLMSGKDFTSVQKRLDYFSIFNTHLSQINCTEFTCVMTFPVFMTLYKALLDLSSECFEHITIHVLAVPALLHTSAKDLCKKIMPFFSLYPRKKILFYSADPSVSNRPANDFLIVKDAFMIRPVSLLFTQAEQCTAITDPEFVSENYDSVMAYLEHTPSLWISAPDRSLIARTESYRFDLDTTHRYLCHILAPTANAKSLSSLLDETFSSESDSEFVYKKYRQDTSHIRDMLVYESTLLDFLSTGHLQISSCVNVALSEKDRAFYLEELIAETRLKSNPMSLQIVKDQNPVLSYTDFSMNLTLGSNTGFLWNCSNDSYEIFYLRTPEAIEIFYSIFRQLKEMPERYLVPQDKSIAFIQRLLEFL